MTTQLPDLVRDELRKRRGNWRVIAIAAGVSHSWMSKFVSGRIPNPGYATLSKLRECLLNPELANSQEKQAPAPTAQAPAAINREMPQGATHA